MASQALPRLTAERYLEIERAAENKSEYHDGQMFAMSGGTLAHSRIEGRLVAALTQALLGGDCDVATSNLRVQAGPHGPFLYPDATVYCGDPVLADGYRDMLLNPTVVFEVLSKSSEAYDRGFKFAHYRQIESLREYVLVSRTEARIEVFTRTGDGKWTLSETVGLFETGAENACSLQSIGCRLKLADIYRGISFETV